MMLLKASPAVLPYLSRHINSSKYEESSVAWHPLIRFNFVLIVTLDILRVYSIGRVNKLYGMVDSVV